MNGLTAEEREALGEYVEDAITFAIGAWAEAQIGVRDAVDAGDLATEFLWARNPVEVERILAARGEALAGKVWALADEMAQDNPQHTQWWWAKRLRALLDAAETTGEEGAR